MGKCINTDSEIESSFERDRQNRQTGKHSVKIHRQMEGKTGRQLYNQTDGEINRKTDRHTNRQPT